MSIRIDKYVEECIHITRKEAKEQIKKKCIRVNGNVINDYGLHVDDSDTVEYKGQKLLYKPFRYYVLNKPAGILTATEDKTCETVLDILPSNLRKGISPVGRLDKDTEGLLLLTNDGELAHRLLSPGKHVPKTYNCILQHTVSADDIKILEKGIDIGEKNLTLPAKAEIIKPNQVYLTITEGKFHQVKRMFESLGNKVIYLERTSFGPLSLSKMNLSRGEYRELSEEEIEIIKKAAF